MELREHFLAIRTNEAIVVGCRFGVSVFIVLGVSFPLVNDSIDTTVDYFAWNLKLENNHKKHCTFGVKFVIDNQFFEEVVASK